MSVTIRASARRSPFRRRSTMSCKMHLHIGFTAVGLDIRLDDRLGGVANTCIDHFHAGVTQGGGNYLCPAIMSIQTWLGNQHTNGTSLDHIVMTPLSIR